MAPPRQPALAPPATYPVLLRPCPGSQVAHPSKVPADRPFYIATPLDWAVGWLAPALIPLCSEPLCAIGAWPTFVSCLPGYLPCEVCAQSFMSSELARDLVVVVCVCAGSLFVSSLDFGDERRVSVCIDRVSYVRGHRERYASLAAHLMFASYNTQVVF